MPATISSGGAIRAPDERISGLLFFVTLGALGIWVPYLAFQPLSFEDAGLEIFVAMSILYYCAIRLSWIAARGRPHLLTLIFFVFIYVFIGVAGTAELLSDKFPWHTVHEAEDVLPALLQVALAIAGYEMGNLFYRVRPSAPTKPRMFAKGGTLILSDRATVWLAVVATLLCGAAIAKIGPDKLLVTRSVAQAAYGVTSSKGANLIYEKLLRIPSFIAFVVVLYNATTRWRTLNGERKRFYLVLGLFLGALAYVTNYPPALSRSWLGVVVLTPAFIVMKWRRWMAAMWVMALGVGLVVAFPYLDLFRDAPTVSVAIDRLQIGQTVTQPLISKPDYDVFLQTINGYVYTEERGISYGYSLLGAALFWFPRSVWPAKPVGTGQHVDGYLGYTFLNLSAPLWMEFNVAFGWFGVALLSFFYGRACAWGERLYEQSLISVSQGELVRVLIPYWAGFQTFIMRGDLQNATAFSSLGIMMLLATALAPRFFRSGASRTRALAPIGTRPRLRL